MSSPDDRRYSDSHEWHKNEDGVVTLGITPFAVNELTHITFVEMKPAGTKVAAGDPVGEVESVKATSDIYTAVAGEIVEVNDKLNDDPSLLNSDPFGDGWLIKLKIEDPSALESLMDASSYDQKYPA